VRALDAAIGPRCAGQVKKMHLEESRAKDPWPIGRPLTPQGAKRRTAGPCP
jgi:hypothetical protein